MPLIEWTNGNFVQGWELPDFPVAFSTGISLVCVPLLDGLVSSLAGRVTAHVCRNGAVVNFGMFYKQLFFSVQFLHIMKPLRHQEGEAVAPLMESLYYTGCPQNCVAVGPSWSGLLVTQ
jgi:hypothetical protein